MPQSHKLLSLMGFAVAASCAAPTRSVTTSELSAVPDLTPGFTTARASKNVASTSYSFGSEVVDHYSFTASNGEGFAKGTFLLYRIQIDAGGGKRTWETVGIFGKLSCMHVDGRNYRYGGVVSVSSFAGIPKGTKMTWSVTDNGVPGPSEDDTGSALYSGPDPDLYCDMGQPYPEVARPMR